MCATCWFIRELAHRFGRLGVWLQHPQQIQLTLLDVAELDSQIARLERSNVKHPLREKLGTIMNAAAARARDKEAEKAVVSARPTLAECETKCMALQGADYGEKPNLTPELA